MPRDAIQFDYTVENAFGDLSFALPMVVVSPPEGNRVFVAEQGGAIKVIPNLDQPVASVFLDISPRV
ncbi:MAG TPA: hypothetical protein VK846_04815, partial [Candidatus Limnocylindria bacterium]|nr:hypothetical protein [Candidatus Limnocylindria bacterium]